MLSTQQRFKQIQELQNNPQNIRNISIVAHVDHGKTTLSDSLISTNNIIHQKSVGKLRYLDSRKDEQLRGITMKSSSISLVYKHEEQQHLINLIDSPGHVEFSSEVSAALRITDGSLVLIDVIEGVSAQTYTVLRQCYQERVKSILVLNKIDRIIKELQMSPQEAYVYLSQIIEQANAILAKFIEVEKDQLLQRKKQQQGLTQLNQEEDELYKQIEQEVYFSPEKGNIIFSSAIDCWAFRIVDFAEIFAKKLECKVEALTKVMYGDYYCNLKTKKISKKPFNSKQNPMFVDFILQNIWTVYERVLGQDVNQIKKLAKSLNIPEIPDKLFTIINKDQSQIIQYIMNNWLPLDKCILKSVITYLPSPIKAQKDRLEIISRDLLNLSDNKDQYNQENYQQLEQLKDSISNCDNSENAPLVIFIAKMLYVPKSFINERNLKDIQTQKNEPEKRFIGFARIFSGKVKKGQKVYVIQPKKENGLAIVQAEEAQLNDIYLMMAQNLDSVEEVGAGNILALGNLEDIVFKTATVSSVKCCPLLLPIHLGSRCILKVALMAKDFKDQAILVEGLKKLNKFDPSVDVSMQANGDVILATCGQVHLERCITDLEEMTEIQVKTSEPIVSFKETVAYKKLTVAKNIQKVKQQNYDENEEEKEIDDQQKTLLIIRKMSNVDLKEDIVDNTEKDEEPDIRYGLKQMQEDQELKEGKKFHNLYGQEKELKRMDYFNSGKTLASLNNVNLLEIQSKPNLISLQTPNKKIEFQVRCIGFDFQLAQWLEKNQEQMRKIFQTKQPKRVDVESFLSQFQHQVEEHISDKRLQKLIFEKLVCFGPDSFGPNLLIQKDLDTQDSVIAKLKKMITNNNQKQQDKFNNQTDQQNNEDLLNKEELQQNELLENTSKQQQTNENQTLQQLINNLYKIKPEEIINSIIQGFNMAVISGPLCQEPMIGVCFIIEKVTILQEDKEEEIQDQEKNQQENKEKQPEEEQKKDEIENNNNNNNNNISLDDQSSVSGINSESTTINLKNKPTNKNDKDCYGPISGQIISTIKDCCMESFLGACPRLVEGMYLCHLQCDTDSYPKVWDVLNRRRAKPVNDELQESSNLFIISAHLPLIESFNFYSEMQIKTSGRVHAQLVFDTWLILENDPFFVPMTQEELEEHGEKIQTPNFAKALIDKIRKRKGISTEEKVVESAEKQNNINRKR